MKADAAVVNRLLRTARGQIDGILKMVEEDKYCMDISHQLLACEAILRKTNREVLRGHMEGCVQDALSSTDPEEKSRKIEELVALIEKMSK